MCVYIYIYTYIYIYILQYIYIYIHLLFRLFLLYFMIFTKSARGRLFSRQQLSGLPIHIKILVILINIDYYILSVSNRALYRALESI